jgi:trypsin
MIAHLMSAAIVPSSLYTHQAQPGRYSYMAALTEGLRENGSIESYCGGSMVAPDVMLTAAHCVDGSNLTSVAIGGHNKRQWKGEVIAMSKIFVHEDWDDWTFKNDFAIVVLERATTMDITFPKLNDDDLYPADGTISRVMGWGATEYFGRQSKKLLEVDIPVISNEDCDECYGGNFTIFDSMICAYQTGGGVDSCNGKCSLFMDLLV